jgi:uncharacterized BrkB/YihY/UPF0761 family membrane protein
MSAQRLILVTALLKRCQRTLLSIYNTVPVQLFLKFLKFIKLALWRSFEHDAFATAKASAYSCILTVFPALLVLGRRAGIVSAI